MRSPPDWSLYYPRGVELTCALPRRLPVACRVPAWWTMEVSCLLLADSDSVFCTRRVEHYVRFCITIHQLCSGAIWGLGDFPVNASEFFVQWRGRGNWVMLALFWKMVLSGRPSLLVLQGRKLVKLFSTHHWQGKSSKTHFLLLYEWWHVLHFIVNYCLLSWSSRTVHSGKLMLRVKWIFDAAFYSYCYQTNFSHIAARVSHIGCNLVT